MCRPQLHQSTLDHANTVGNIQYKIRNDEQPSRAKKAKWAYGKDQENTKSKNDMRERQREIDGVVDERTESPFRRSKQVTRYDKGSDEASYDTEGAQFYRI